MNQTLQRVLFIDDSKNDNFFHTRVLNKHGGVEEVVVKESPQEALIYLSTMTAGSYPCPDVIFLDVNMPGMDGWDFIEAYRELSTIQKGKIILLMLSVPLSPVDEARARAEPLIDGFVNKPLSKEKLDNILQQYFPAD